MKKSQPLNKVPTGVIGLDKILRGGIPEGRTTLISGGPGSGKSVLSVQSLIQNVQNGRSAVLVSFEESADMLRENAQTLGWDIPALEKAGKLFILQPEIDFRAIKSGEYTIEGLIAILEAQAKRIGAELIAIDALDVLTQLFNDPIQERNELYLLNRSLTEQGATILLTAKVVDASQRNHFLQYIADCVIYMDQQIGGQVSTRRMRVLKYRGSGYSSNEHPFIISPEGIVVMPVSSVELGQKPLGALVSAGNPDLDEILGGGVRKSSAVLISGPTGIGKTTLACTFAVKACERGERVLYVSFEESEAALVGSMSRVGLDLASVLKSKKLKILTAMPESLGAEEHLFRILQGLSGFQADHFVLDAVSGAQRIGSPKAAFDLMIRLLSACKEEGITSIFIDESPEGNMVPGRPRDMGAALSLLDAIVTLSYVHENNGVGRSLLVLKSRGGEHSHETHPFLISSKGIQLRKVSSGT